VALDTSSALHLALPFFYGPPLALFVLAPPSLDEPFQARLLQPGLVGTSACAASLNPLLPDPSLLITTRRGVEIVQPQYGAVIFAAIHVALLVNPRA